MKENKLTIEDMLYRFFLCFLIIMFVGYLVMTHIPVDLFHFPCIFRQLTHLYCPGCGGTRAIKFLLHGKIIESLFYHPFVGYSIGCIVIFMISHTARYITKGKIKGLAYRNLYLFIGLLIIVLNVIWKNYELVVNGIALIT